MNTTTSPLNGTFLNSTGGQLDNSDVTIALVAVLSGVLVILIISLTIHFLIRGVAVKRSYDRRHTGVHETDTSQVEVVRRVRTRRGKQNGTSREASQRMLDEETFRLTSDDEDDEFV